MEHIIDKQSHLTVTVNSCARCGKDHIKLEFKMFKKNPIDDCNYWAMCPVLQEPILLKIVDKGDQV